MASGAAPPPRSLPRHPRAPLLALVWALGIGAASWFSVRSLAPLPYEPPVRPEPEAHPALFTEATAAYHEGRWDEARQAFDALLALEPDHERALDYRGRLDAIAAEAEALARAEEALAGGRVAEATALASTVPPNSPLFAQAEALLRVSQHPASEPQHAAAGSPDGEGAFGVELSGVLQQADALYREGNFVEAAARARQLAHEAEGETRQALLRWSRRCERLGELFGHLGGVQGSSPLGGISLTYATEALVLDRRLGGAHGRGLRPRVVDAYLALVRADWEQGRPRQACARWVQGWAFESRESAWQGFPARCREAARRALEEAEKLASRGRADEARARREAALHMVPADDPLRQQTDR